MEPEVKDIIFDTNLKQIQQEMKDTAKVAKMMGQSFKENSSMNFSEEDAKVVAKYKETLEDMMKYSTSTGTKLIKVIDGFKLTSFADGTATIEKMGDAAEETGEKVEDIGKKANISFKGGLKTLTKFMLGLVGIRTVWSVLTRASHQYMEENKEINASLKLTFSILGNLIGPAIKELVNVVEYFAIVLAKMIQTLTGYDVLAKVSANATKDLAKQAQKAYKALAAFDTITNMTQNEDAMESYKATLEAYDDFMDKVGEIEKFWSKWGSWVTAAASALGILWGAKTLGGLAKLIGVAGTAGTAGTGLAGVAGLLTSIGTMAAITITIWAVIKGYERLQDLKDFMEKWNPDYINQRTDSIETTSDVIDYIKESTGEIKDNAAKTGEHYNLFNDMVESIFGNHKDVLKTAQDIVDATEETNKKVEDLINNQAIEKDEAQKLLDYLVEQYRVNGEIETQLFNQGKDTSELQGKQEKLLENIIKIRDGYDVSNAYIWTMYDGVKEINGIHMTDKYVKVNIEADTSSAERTTNGWFTDLKNSFSSFFNRLQMQNFLPHFRLFDVGTNYVPQDQLAMVHKGEMIVPKKYNPMTSGIGGTNEETNELLRQLNNTLEQKQFNGYISASEITNTAINGINQRSRQMGRSVIR